MEQSALIHNSFAMRPDNKVVIKKGKSMGRYILLVCLATGLFGTSESCEVVTKAEYKIGKDFEIDYRYRDGENGSQKLSVRSLIVRDCENSISFQYEDFKSRHIYTLFFFKNELRMLHTKLEK